MKLSKKKKAVLGIMAAGLAVVVARGIWENSALMLNSYVVSSPRLPESFSGFRIAHVSDLHNAQMGKNNSKLLSMISEAQPDMIAISGDLLDSLNTDMAVVLDFVAKAREIAPCYYVTGNHEARQPKAFYDAYEELLKEAGVICLHDSTVFLERDGAKIAIIGVDDPVFALSRGSEAAVNSPDRLAELAAGADFSVLISHRPELFENYVNAEMGLVLSGHAHGGQVRLPFLGGIVAPHQGLFPIYDGGLYTVEDTSMVISRGIGNSIIPLRLNNRPELVIVELRR